MNMLFISPIAENNWNSKLKLIIQTWNESYTCLNIFCFMAKLMFTAYKKKTAKKICLEWHRVVYTWTYILSNGWYLN